MFVWCIRPVGTVRALHLRHDNPGLWPGWDVEAIDVFVVPAAAAAAAQEVGARTAGFPIRV